MAHSMEILSGPTYKEQEEHFRAESSCRIAVKLPRSTLYATTAVVDAQSGPSYQALQILFSEDTSTHIRVKLPTATAHSRYGLLCLPNELLDIVLGMVLRPSHMINIALVNKKLHDAIYPFLYRDMTLDVSSTKTAAAITRLRTAGSSGLQHIRTLTFCSDAPLPGDTVPALDVYSFLKSIAVRTIKHVRFDVEVPRMARCFNVLRTHHPLTSAVSVNKQWDMDSNDWITAEPSVWTSAICSDLLSKACTRGTSQLLRMNPKLRSLELRVGDQDGSPCRSSCRLTIILSFLKPACQHPRSRINALNECACRNDIRNLAVRGGSFKSLNSRDWSNAYLLSHAFDLGRLTSLTLRDCVHTTTVVQALIDTDEAISLKKLVLLSITESRRHESTFFSTLDTLLQRFVGLHVLVCSAESAGLPSVEAISNHCSTLKTLYIDNTSEKGCVYSVAQIATLTRHCTLLKQLALPLPQIDTTAPPTRSFDPIAPTRSWDPALEESLAHLATLPKLVTLRILNLPSALDVNFLLRGMHDLVQTTMAAFDEVKHRNLGVIAWGRLQQLAGESQPNELYCYFRRKATGTEQPPTWTSEIVERHLVKYEEPCSEILNVGLGLCGHMQVDSGC